MQKNTDPDILVQRFVEDELAPDEVREALHRIADDPDARDLLQFELQMTQDLASRHSTAPPSDFAAQTMSTLPAEPATSSAPSLLDRLQQWWTTVTTPVALEVRPASALVATLLLGTVLTVSLQVWPNSAGSSASVQTASTSSASTSASVQRASAQSGQGETVWIRFMYTNSTADSVAVAGDFSQWDPVELSPRTVNGETVWTGLVPVSRGEHEYQFVINGERWVPDPLAPVKRSDGFGAKNAVLEI